MHVPFTVHRISGICGLIRVGVLCGGVRFGIDIKEETEEEEGGSLNIHFFAYFIQRRL
jgi:hypothetical protein